MSINRDWQALTPSELSIPCGSNPSGPAKRHVTLTFCLDEDVTPDHLARRVAEAAARAYAIRPGEGVRLPSDPNIVLTAIEPVEEPSLGGWTAKYYTEARSVTDLTHDNDEPRYGS